MRPCHGDDTKRGYLTAQSRTGRSNVALEAPDDALALLDCHDRRSPREHPRPGRGPGGRRRGGRGRLVRAGERAGGREPRRPVRARDPPARPAPRRARLPRGGRRLPGRPLRGRRERRSRLLGRRARVVFAGWLFGRENRFKLELAISPADMGFDPNLGPTRTPLLDWYIDFRHLRDLEIRVGQYKLPFSRERVISSGDLQMVDRSLANAELNIDRDFGIDLRSRDFLGLGLLRYYAGVSTGEGRDAGFGDDLSFWYFGRVEVLPLGMFDDYTEADLARSSQPRLSLGAAYAFLHEAPRLRGALGPVAEDGGTTDYHLVTADAMLKWAGLSVYAEMIWREGSRNPGSAEDGMGNPLPVTPPRNGIGWYVQAGYLLPGVDFEIAARYGMLHPLGDPASTTFPERGELGGAISYYFGEHSFKLQLDYFHLWQDGDFGDSEEQVRLQLQAAL
ncbi:MAG: OprO/OprP family phosphate-selective porin [Sandaracinaceae bacterium]|nr:OprO/OprP family phosphate-selective porin [Sandaracinaceae bacterium]